MTSTTFPPASFVGIGYPTPQDGRQRGEVESSGVIFREYPIGGQKAQEAIQRVLMGAGGCGKFLRGPGRFSHKIGKPKFCGDNERLG